jgi:hypothetical protein
MKQAQMFSYSFRHYLQNKAGSDGYDAAHILETEKDSAVREGPLVSKILSSDIRVEEVNREASPESVEVEESEDEREGDEEGSWQSFFSLIIFTRILCVYEVE